MLYFVRGSIHPLTAFLGLYIIFHLLTLNFHLSSYYWVNKEVILAWPFINHVVVSGSQACKEKKEEKKKAHFHLESTLRADLA